MAELKRLCVYCGSSGRVDEAYRAAATTLGGILAREGIELVYGGGRVGLMGLCADAALAGGGRVTGIIPAHLHDEEIGHRGLSELIVVGSMHERKRMMFDRSDAFAILPGGLGTLDEAFEMITWRQLHLHDKPIVVVDVDGYWAPFQALVEHVVEKNFAGAGSLALYRTVERVEDLVPAIRHAHQPAIEPEPRLV
jgi:uncharacterized protein (TIGR00730 family)